MTESIQNAAGSHYTVLARRFRPQAFDQVVGQEHVAKALQNAIRNERVAHAYLFTGARGVGKTSTARILAKALNCPKAVDGIPCNECEICEGITSGHDVDTLEIDGASNNGVDNIRNLRANVGVRSMRTQYKVYIIDEVHMLSIAAFNALLKTLEEPPPNVKFVFCTTEPNKVPDTILSRCQRFDFSAIGEQSIVDRLREIAAVEGFEVAEEALELVARRARGSMRDSQSLFDQLLAFSEGKIEADDVHRMLGTATDEQLVRLFDAIVQHRPGDVLNALDESLNAGVQSGEFMDQTIAYIRDLMVLLSAGAEVPLSSVSSRFREPLQAHATSLGLPTVMAAFQILANAKNQMFRSTFARTLLEMALVQISVLENLTALSDVLSGRLPALVDGAAQPDASSEEKKNADDEQPVAEPTLTLREHKAEELLRRLGRECGLAMTAALRSVTDLKVPSPDRLELQFAADQPSARRVIEEHRSELESTLKTLTGNTVHLSLTTEQVSEAPATSQTESENADPGSSPADDNSVSEPSQSRSFAKRAPRARAPETIELINDIDPLADNFVREVSEVFGGKVVRVTPAPSLNQGHTDDTPDAAQDQ